MEWGLHKTTKISKHNNRKREIYATQKIIETNLQTELEAN